jgi:parallel beta-helix repeat protein
MTFTSRDGKERTMQLLQNTIRILFCSVILFGLLYSNSLILNCQGAGSTIYVDITNTQGPWNGTLFHPYRLIQDAVDAAQDGSTISIAVGTYSETIIIQKSLILVGEQRETTIIDGSSNGHVVHVQGTSGQPLSAQISSLTIKGAQGLGYDCIALSYVNSGSITDNILMNSAQSDGIQLDHCTNLNIANNLIKNNQGSGISLTLSETNTLSNNVIQDNQKGIYIYLTSNDNIVRDNQITDNSQYGIYIVQSSDNYLYRNDFSNNGQNAQDASSNIWSYASNGNYWDDYNNYDENPADGIGDVPYSIPGGSNQDGYPLGYFLDADPPQQGNNPPTAFVPTIYPTTTDFGDEVSLTGGGSDSDGYIVEYYWRSSIDGYLSDEKSFSTSDLNSGNHQIYLKVRDNDGEWSNEKSASITVNSIDNAAPTASIIYVKPDEINYGEVVFFNGQGIDSDGTIVGYKWESNKDGVLGDEKSFSLNSLSAGTHTISFTVQDDNGRWSAAVTSIVIVVLTIDDSSIIADAGGPYYHDSFSVYFNASDSIGGTDFFWDFGDGTFGSGITISHTYPNPGNYTVKLTIRNDDGNISSATTYVNISEAAQANDSPQGIDALSFELPMELIIIVQIIIVVGCIGFFFLWMKHK